MAPEPVDRQWTHREMLCELQLLEPRRTVLTAIRDTLLRGLAVTLPIGGIVVGAVISTSWATFPAALGSGLLVFCCGSAAEYVRRQGFWHRGAARRLALYSAMPTQPDGTVWILAAWDDMDAVWDALSRAGLYTGREAATLGAAPSDAPTLNSRVFARKPDAFRTPGDEGAKETAIAALRAARIRARVGSVDVDFDPGPGTMRSIK